MVSKLEVVKGGGIALLTDDLVVKVVVQRCGELERELKSAYETLDELRHRETARYRTLRRDVAAIKRKVCSPTS